MSGIREIQKLKYWLENSKDENVLLGWYSEKQRKVNWELRHSKKKTITANVWLTPEGKEVLATCVTRNYNYGCEWDDMKCVGPVVKWVKPIYNIHKYFN